MKRLENADIIIASREIPLERSALVAYIEAHMRRLMRVNPDLAALITLISNRAEGTHEEIMQYSPIEFRLYISSLFLILLRSIEVAEAREESGASETITDPNADARELIQKLMLPQSPASKT
jgi:hypothetical protein